MSLSQPESNTDLRIEVFGFESTDDILKSEQYTQMDGIEHNFPGVPLIMPYEVVLTFESVDKILTSNH